jgi:hypothetical protein
VAALYSFASWNVFTLGFFAGVLHKRRRPTESIASSIIK